MIGYAAGGSAVPSRYMSRRLQKSHRLRVVQRRVAGTGAHRDIYYQRDANEYGSLCKGFLQVVAERKRPRARARQRAAGILTLCARILA